MKTKFNSLLKISVLFSLTIIVFGCSPTEHKQAAHPNSMLPGKYNGYTLLPNGWKLTPEGSQVEIGELPLNMVLTKDGRYAVTSNSGMGENSLSVVDVKEGKEVQRLEVDKTWYGLSFNSDDSKLYVSGADNNCVYIYDFKNGNLALNDSIMLGDVYKKEKISVSGLDYLKKTNSLLAVSKENNSLYLINLNTKKVSKTLEMPGACYDVKTDHSTKYAYVSVWGKSEIAQVDLSSFKITNLIKVGDHPCQVLINKDDSRLFVTNANNNTTSVVDLKKLKQTEIINSALTSEVPYGSTPDAICFNSDENVLMVANADNNYLALFDISEPNKTKSLGFIPVGWYPTAVKYDETTNQIIVANGKGLASMPNPNGPDPLKRQKYSSIQYIGSLFKGTLSIINYPDEETLSVLSKKVYSNTPYVYKTKNWVGIQNVIPDKHDLEGSPKIKHVFYIIKENRTYDQVYGDIKEGNGDSSLCIFPYKITPNQHTLTQNYTLYDNFYADAEVSADGHNWSTAAYASDYVEKNWPVYYGGRGGGYYFEGGYPLAAPSSGYIWNNVIDHGKSFRDYGEFVEDVKGEKGKYEARDDDIKKYVCKTYPGWNLEISDVVRYEKWKEDFEKMVKGDSLPALNILRLPNDHTMGTRKGALTPLAYVAQNDYALGKMVDEISHSKFWKSSIIFVIEDDAQNGSDHVDAHRSTLLVISPYIKNHFVDHTMYSTSSVLKTIELILGLPPMTQYDLSATPILFSIQNTPDMKPFNSIKPLIDINATNTGNEYGAVESSEFDFAKEDAAPDVELNEIIWKSIRGRNSKMPPPVRSAFVKIVHQKDKGDD